ncbi:OLC1v1033123C1 [Oldenlandia corymbosa var. corymbosa]|uniref:OLC1v1033123C1 n=1 Tax=Oldenlandia corymbosa var. corymbosa TaxID=529605 RepID=A0AAV1CMN4_OLDCO|nr:OLC1v1033123C1 [Oldenlandia corymbosa var. corymbosa]
MAPIQLLILVVAVIVLCVGSTKCLAVTIAQQENSSTNDDDLQRICSMTNYPPLCFQSYKADPRTPGADLKTLAQIAIDFSKPRAQSALDLVTGLHKNATDKTLATVLGLCVKNYTQSVELLDLATEAMNSKDYDVVAVRGVCARTDSDWCKYGFGSEVEEPKELKKAGQVLRDSLHPLTIIVADLIRSGSSQQDTISV